MEREETLYLQPGSLVDWLLSGFGQLQNILVWIKRKKKNAEKRKT